MISIKVTVKNGPHARNCSATRAQQGIERMYISNISDCVLRRLHKKYQNDVNSNETLLSRTVYMSVS